tara:strand:- start:572 stop:973 length:402 start_codon:yes stop_codon:yes gene_type:complete
MLYCINDDTIDLDLLIIENCGPSYSIFKRILSKNFGSIRYLLRNIQPKTKVDINNYSDSIYLNFDLRDKGIVFYFRFMNTEYVEFCNYNRLSFQTSDQIFTLQTDSNIYDFKILNISKHLIFIDRLYKFKMIK